MSIYKHYLYKENLVIKGGESSYANIAACVQWLNDNEGSVVYLQCVEPVTVGTVEAGIYWFKMNEDFVKNRRQNLAWVAIPETEVPQLLLMQLLVGVL